MDPNQKTPYPPAYPSMPMPGQPQLAPPQYPMNQQAPYPPQQQHQSMPPPSYDIQGQPVITQQPTTTTVIVQQSSFGPNPQAMQCHQCKANIVSAVSSEPSTKTHLIALVICLLGCWAGCCLIPYCVDSCQSQTHQCPNCGTYLGTHN